MYIYDKIMKYKRPIKLYVDMDGVITDYDIDHPYDFANKRPLVSNIEKLKRISEIDGVEMFILSICNTKDDINDKNNWLDKNASFFKKENRNILPKVDYPNLMSKEIKRNFLINIDRDNTIILIDDDNGVLKFLKKELKNIVLIQDSSLVD